MMITHASLQAPAEDVGVCTCVRPADTVASIVWCQPIIKHTVASKVMCQPIKKRDSTVTDATIGGT